MPRAGSSSLREGDYRKQGRMIAISRFPRFQPHSSRERHDYRESDQKALADVQGSTQSEKARFHGYRSAQEVHDNFMSDLHSETAKRMNKELRRLKLPRLPDVKDEFLKFADGNARSQGKTRSAERA
jgi:hypothetical protein